ncbi:MAG: T9SS type A sorting domain-containing protein, partial [Saprospiraceae bacterium]|nr:T9SS type A sorting domain-containing protein [Saprospiraceae bacterium]
YIPWGNNAGNTQVLNVANLTQNGTLHNFGLTAGNSSNWVGRERDRLPYCNPDHFAWIEGDNYGNYSGRSKVYDGDIFSAEIQVRLSPTGQPFNSPVFTRRDVKGNIVFRTLLGFEGMITDFIRTDEGCFLLTGYFPKFQLNFDNRSFIARVQPNGTIDWVNAYNFGERETLNRIIRSDNPSPAAFPYIISGIVRPQPPTNGLNTYDDIILLAIDNQGSIGWMRNIGDFGNGVTDDEYHADLMNYQGGYALAGSYRNTLISQAVIFRTNNTGTTQLPSSAQYPLNTFIYDIEPSADGTGIIVAGQVVYGTALLAKVDPNGQTIWSLTFPALRAFRRVVVMPNGDIYAVGQRNPTAPFRNVIVKLKDFGTGYSLVWQKYADQPGENNWGAADLAWYSGKMFFYTDTRYNNPNGWPSGDIAAVLYNLDQSPDNCPFTKEQLPAVQSYVLVGAQMGAVANNPVTPPLAQQFPAGVPFQLQRDSLCPGYSCSCNFVSLSISKTWPIPVWSVPLSCNQAPVALPGCPSQYNPLRFNGRLQCKGGCAFNGLSYTLKDPAGATILTGNISTPSFSIQLPLSVLQTQGVYTMTLDGKCGNMNCQSCVIQFTVPSCPPPCSCAEPGFTNDVSAGFNWVQYPNCQFKFTPKKLTACDQVEWKVATSGSNNFNMVGVTTGNQTLTHTFPTTQQYVVCMTVTRTPAGGAPCIKSRCWTIDVDCSLEPQAAAGSADFGGFDACSGTVIDNGGFTEGALEGGLADNGGLSRWAAAAGNPEVALEAGNNDPNLVRLRGRLQTADLLYQDSLPLTIWDSLRFSMALRPVQGLIMPGTELVVMISENKPEGIGCADSTCLEIMRLPVPDDLDSSFWLKTNSLFILKNMTPRYLSVWVENPFADDEALNSVVDIDNVCLSRFDIVSEKTPPENGGSMRIYPNPNAGIFTVDLLGGGMEGGTLKVIDLAGKLLMSQPVETGHAHQHIHAQNLPGGFYLLQWTNEGKVMAVGRFVKQ